MISIKNGLINNKYSYNHYYYLEINDDNSIYCKDVIHKNKSIMRNHIINSNHVYYNLSLSGFYYDE